MQFPHAFLYIFKVFFRRVFFGIIFLKNRALATAQAHFPLSASWVLQGLFLHPMPFARARREDFWLQIRALSTAGARFSLQASVVLGGLLWVFLVGDFY